MELISNLFQFAVTLLGFCMSGIRSVSYTHLDVYKRQEYRSLSFCEK